jgi:hypothetical protein
MLVFENYLGTSQIEQLIDNLSHTRSPRHRSDKTRNVMLHKYVLGLNNLPLEPTPSDISYILIHQQIYVLQQTFGTLACLVQISISSIN